MPRIRRSAMNRPAIIPPITDEDRLPHEKAVWRPYLGVGGSAAHGTKGLQVSVEYEDGQIAQGISPGGVNWVGVKRWRFGWAPND